MCASSVLGSARGGTSMTCSQPAFLAHPDVTTILLPWANLLSGLRMAFNHGNNHLEHEKRQVRFADDPGRSDCLTAERNLEDYSRCATCSVQCDNGSHLLCVQCGAGTCVGCLVSNACPACYHAWRELPGTSGTPALARQRQEWRAIRKGTQTLLDSGTARAELLHDHGVRPHFVGRVLRAEVDRSRQALATMAVSRPTVKNTFLTEYCCHPDSAMSAAWVAAGGQAIRVCLPDYDVSHSCGKSRGSATLQKQQWTAA